MKRLLIGLVAAASLVASVLVLVTSVSSPTAAQTLPTVTLTNTSTAVAANSPAAELFRNQRRIAVTVATVNNCNAGSRTPLSNGQYTLSAAETNPTAVAGSEITGLLANTCNWEITFRNTAGFCGVTATVRGYNSGAGGAPNIAGGVVALGTPDTDGTLVLSGAGSGALRYGGGHVTQIDFASSSPSGCATSFSVGTPDINVPQVNAQGQTDDGTNNAYRGFEFTVGFSSSTAGCIATSGTYVIDAAGESALKSGTNAPFIVDRTLTQLGGTARCEYAVSFSPTEVGNLRLASTPAATSQVSGANAAGSPAVVPAGFISATYLPITVGIVVRSTFPTDEVFTTNDTVDYFINVNSPCGGFLGVIPSAFGSQGDSASTLVFPGTITVYGSALNPIQNTAKQYSVNAFADPAGDRPCSVTVTQRNGPERCSVVGGPSQTNTYSAGASVLTFEFNHICEPAGVASGVTGGDDENGPPAPPEIDLGLDPDDGENGPPAPPAIDLPETPGPQEEGRTG